MNRFGSWNFLPRSEPAAIHTLHWQDQAAAFVKSDRGPILGYGKGRSYGDVCLNSGGVLAPTAGLNRLIEYDRASGLLTAEAGVTLGEIQRLALPDGWFTPVTPGTRHVTLGGAIANDVHGKEHVTHGAIGRHVRRFTLWRSTDGRVECTPSSDLFGATIGGLGLTGLITAATLQLRKIAGPTVRAYQTVGNCLLEGALENAPHAVAWLDASAPLEELGRGVITAGDFAPGLPTSPTVGYPAPPFFPSGLLNRWSLNALNAAKWRFAQPKEMTLRPEDFFQPLDRIAGWNRFYGSRGFYQHQSVVPRSAGVEPIRELLRVLRRMGGASFVSVLKAFGPLESPGMLSFPREGLTLALDLPNEGRKTLGVLDALDEMVLAAGGRLYPAKDARMSSAMFRAGYPRWEEFSKWIDPAFSSNFWRRVTAP